MARTLRAKLEGWIRYLLDLARLLHQKQYRQRRYLLAELSIESKACSLDNENGLTYQLAPCRAEKPWARPEEQPGPCPGLGKTWRTQAVYAGDASRLQPQATAGLSELAVASTSSRFISTV